LGIGSTPWGKKKAREEFPSSVWTCLSYSSAEGLLSTSVMF
jgi:hypothetical protein